MKCLKSSKTGEIIRVKDEQANRQVGSEWQFVPKSEWKLATRKVTVNVETSQEADSQTISEKQLNRKKKYQTKK